MPSERQLTPVALPWAPGGAALAPTAPGPTPAPTVRPTLRPLPTLPIADRATYDAEDRMRLAVALDVLCTATRRIAPGPTILAQMVHTWLRLRGSGDDGEAQAALLQRAQSPQGTARARIASGLTAAAQVVGSGTHLPTHGASAPQTVAAAARRVEAAGDRLVDEAVLWLSSQRRVDYRRG